MFQELTVLAHAVLYSESTGNIDAVFSSGTAGNSVEKPKYRFKRSESFCGIKVPEAMLVGISCQIAGGNLRALFTFKAYGSRQHLVIRTEVNS